MTTEPAISYKRHASSGKSAGSTCNELVIALDVHRSFAKVAIPDNGKLRDAGKIDLDRSRLVQFARKLNPITKLSSATRLRLSGCYRVVGRVVIFKPILVRDRLDEDEDRQDRCGDFIEAPCERRR